MVIRPVLVVLCLLPALGACGEPPTSAPPPPSARGAQRYEVTTTVLESPRHGPQLCLGGIAESYPPQCGGPDVVGWDWGLVEGEESANQTTWGTYHLVGTWDGEQFTLLGPPGPPEQADQADVDEPDFSTPCRPPPGGWAVVDADTATEEGLQAAAAYARSQPDFAGMWVDQSMNPAADASEPDERAMNDPRRLVLNLRFTGDLERHEAQVREVWGGALCISEAERRLRELRRIQEELHREVDGALSSSVDEVRGVVEISVIAARPGEQERLDERYGEGVVELRGVLTPVE